MNNLLEQVYNQSFEDELIKISNRLSPEKYKALYDYNESVKKLIKPEYPYLHRAAIPLGLIGGAITGSAAGYGLSKLFKNPKLKVVSSVIGPGAGFLGGAAYGGMFGKKLVEKTPYYKKFTELGMKLQEDLNKQSAFKGREIFKRLNPIRGKSPLSKILLNNKGGGFSPRISQVKGLEVRKPLSKNISQMEGLIGSAPQSINIKQVKGLTR